MIGNFNHEVLLVTCCISPSLQKSRGVNRTKACVICGAVLTEENSADEHVIPNALGGLLKTKDATCRTCNSKSGATFDSKLVSALAGISTTLDVRRDRGKHPDWKFTDEVSGLEHYIAPGGKAAVAPNPVFEETPTGGKLTVNAPTKEEAERLAGVFAGSRFTSGQVSLTETPTDPCRWSFSLTPRDEEIARAITKIAVCYAANRGLYLRAESAAIQFLRQIVGAPSPVCWAFSNVVTFSDQAPVDLTHSITLCQRSPCAPVFALVVLFQFFEFVVLLDECGPDSWHISHYSLDLVTGMPRERTVTWIASTVELMSWRNRADVPLEHAKAQGAGLFYWLKHPTELWFTRASASGAARFAEAKWRGADDSVANSQAEAAVGRDLEKRGFILESLKLEMAPIRSATPESP